MFLVREHYVTAAIGSLIPWGFYSLPWYVISATYLLTTLCYLLTVSKSSMHLAMKALSTCWYCFNLGCSLPGDVPGVSQRLPELVFLYGGLLTQQPDALWGQEGHDDGRGQLLWTVVHQLQRDNHRPDASQRKVDQSVAITVLELC